MKRMMKMNSESLLMYLDRLIKLQEAGFQVSREINEAIELIRTCYGLPPKKNSNIYIDENGNTTINGKITISKSNVMSRD
jgi:hypothetical protein